MLKTKKLQGVFICLTLIVLLSGCSFLGIGEKDNQLDASSDSSKESISPITGVAIDEGSLARKPLAVMINNSTAARPQSGLDKADLVYEFLAEGGITRLLAVFLHNDVEEIGPVRSARPYFIVKALELEGLYVHCGGSTDALEDIERFSVANLDEFKIGTKAFWRSNDRVAPHNLYTSTEKLWTYATDKGMNGPSAIQGFEFLDQEEENANGQPAENIYIKYSSTNYNVTYKYNSQDNTYYRFNGPGPHVDKVTGKQLQARNVLVQYAQTLARDDSRLEIDLLGQGDALLFNNGKVYKGSWQKNSLREQTVFLDQAGNEFKLVPGQTWIQVVPTTSEVKY